MANEQNLTPWKKGQSGNPNGRPKKSFNKINDQLKAEGYEVLKKSEMLEACQLLFNCDETKLRELEQDKETPYAIKVLIKELIDVENRGKTLSNYRDWLFGKATVTKDITSGGKEINVLVLPENGRETKV